MAKPFLRAGIPHNSVFSVSVKPKTPDPDAPFVVSAHLRKPNGSEEDWPEPILKNGRKRTLKSPTTSPRTYSGTIQIDFVGSTTVIVSMEVARADGSRHVYKEEVRGTNGTIDRTIVALGMAQN